MNAQQQVAMLKDQSITHIEQSTQSTSKQREYQILVIQFLFQDFKYLDIYQEWAT